MKQLLNRQCAGRRLGAGLLTISFLLATSCSESTGLSAVSDLTPKIYTTGTAERRVEPNIALINFAVSTRAPQAEKARDDNATRVNAVLEKIKELKLSDDDFHTIDYRIQEVMNYKDGQQKVDGYEVLSRMQLKVHDLKTIGKTVDLIISAGVNKIDGIDFDVAEKNDIYKELLEEATQQAKDKAIHMAEAGGVGKITILEAREEYANPPMPIYRFAMAEKAGAVGSEATPIAGVAILKAQVSLTARAK